jgi:hypothetical protein
VVLFRKGGENPSFLNINNINHPFRVEMNYLKTYCNLIRKAENRTPPEGYTEKHHTFPKSIFGNNNRIVVLTAREHYIAHALLEKICIKRYGLNHWKTQKMICAHISMTSKGNYYNSYLYENVKKRFSNCRKGLNNPFYGKQHNNETRKKLSEAGKKSVALKLGAHGRSEEKKKEDSKKSGKISGHKHYANKTGLFSLSKEEKLTVCSKGGKIMNKQKWKCTVTGFISTAGPLSLYQKKRSIDTSNRIKII